jgi:hypothetical protein
VIDLKSLAADYPIQHRAAPAPSLLGERSQPLPQIRVAIRRRHPAQTAFIGKLHGGTPVPAKPLRLDKGAAIDTMFGRQHRGMARKQKPLSRIAEPDPYREKDTRQKRFARTRRNVDDQLPYLARRDASLQTSFYKRDGRDPAIIGNRAARPPLY